MPSEVLRDQVAIVTGGTRGIGCAIASAFLDAGATVVINGRSAEKGHATVAELGGGDNLRFIQADVKQRTEVESLVDRTVAEFGRLDILVNNAGGAANNAYVVDLTDEALEDALRWNVWSTFWAMRRALQTMIPQRSGRIINMASVEAKDGLAGNVSYVMGKRAIVGLTRVCAKEVAEYGITVNALCPGLIETDLVMAEAPSVAAAMGITYAELCQRFGDASSIKRMNAVEEVAAVALLLATPNGAAVTGASISIDGGTAAY